MWSVIFLAIMLMTGCQSSSPKNTNFQPQTWQEEVEMIDQEIDRLIHINSNTRHRANEQERQSLLYMRDDWNTYAEMIENVEEDHKLSKQTENEIKKLKAQKQRILEVHNRSQ